MKQRTTADAGAGGETAAATDALERLRDERRQIEELFETYAAHRRDPQTHRSGEAARLSSLIFTLLRVHDALETDVVEPALQRHVGDHPSLLKASARRQAVRDAVERVEAMPAGDAGHTAEMATLGLLARAWFEIDETEVFVMARHSGVDLAKLDMELAERQEALLSAGRTD